MSALLDAELNWQARIDNAGAYDDALVVETAERALRLKTNTAKACKRVVELAMGLDPCTGETRLDF